MRGLFIVLYGVFVLISQVAIAEDIELFRKKEELKGCVIIYKGGERYPIYDMEFFAYAKSIVSGVCANIDDVIKELVYPEMVENFKVKESGIEVLFGEKQRTMIKLNRSKIEYDRVYIPITGKLVRFGATIFFGDSKYGYEGTPPYVNKNQLAEVIKLFNDIIASDAFDKYVSSAKQEIIAIVRLIEDGDTRLLPQGKVTKVVKKILYHVILLDQQDINVDPILIHQIKNSDRQCLEIIYNVATFQSFEVLSGKTEDIDLTKFLIIVPRHSTISSIFLGTPSYDGKSMYKISFDESSVQLLRKMFVKN